MSKTLFRIVVVALLVGNAALLVYSHRKVNRKMDENEAKLNERLDTLSGKVDETLVELKALREALENNPDVDLSDEVKKVDDIIGKFAPPVEPEPDPTL